jgi:glycosyltransferase involved in cell wall biosynthesis
MHDSLTHRRLNATHPNMKLIIQIPCYNEEQTLRETLADLPRQVEGFASVEWLIIDDGSKDCTVEVARECGVDHIVRHPYNKGLARAFMTGVLAAVRAGADVIVNTDADNQYCAADIPAIVAPILAGEADIVIGTRPIQTIEHFSPLKRFLQRLGSRIVRTLSGADIHDAPSGFRAITRNTALRLNVFNAYTYTLETIIQAGVSNLHIVSVPIRVNGPTRPSRLVKSIASYVRRSIVTMLGVYLIYRPVQILGMFSVLFLVPSFYYGFRYLWLNMTGHGQGHVQSVIIAAILFVCSTFMIAIGIIAHLLAINRRLLEEIRFLAYSRNIQDEAKNKPGTSKELVH